MDQQRIDEILPKFAGKKILVVGDVVLDHYVFGNVERLNPEAPVPVLHAKQERDETGGAGNVAKNAAAAGASVVLISVIGADETARAIKEAVKREGYKAILIEDSSRPSIRKTRFLVKGQQLLRVDHEETHDISAEIAEQLIAAIGDQLAAGVDAVIVSDYAKGAVTAGVGAAIMKLGAQMHVPIVADVKPSRIKYFKGAAFISPNTKEGHEYLGLNHLDQGGMPPEKLAAKLRDEFITDVYLTLGAQGVQVCTSRELCHVMQDHVVEVADTSGAGDTSVAMMTLAHLCGASPREIALIANAAGAVVVSKIGAVGISVEELRAQMLTLTDKKVQ